MNGKVPHDVYIALYLFQDLSGSCEVSVLLLCNCFDRRLARYDGFVPTRCL